MAPLTFNVPLDKLLPHAQTIGVIGASIALMAWGASEVLKGLAVYERATRPSTAIHSNYGLAPNPRLVWKPSECHWALGRCSSLNLVAEAWIIHLEHGGADRFVEVGRTVQIGQTVKAHGQTWIVYQVNAETHQAHAKPVDPLTP